MKKATWEDVKGDAETICNVRTFGVDLEWAKRAWEILEDTPLCEYSSNQEYNIILIRLFCIGEIIHIYNYFAMDESYEPYDAYTEWIDELELQKIEFIFLAGEQYYLDSYIEEYGEISEVVNHLLELHYDMVVKWLIKGFGGKGNMIASLESPTEEDGDGSLSYEDAITIGMEHDDVHISEHTIRLYQWKESDFTRDYA